MVLSNKKLKQKARAALANSLTASVGQDHSLDADRPVPDSQPRSLKELLDAATLKPRLSKREKRRKALASSRSFETVAGDEEEEENTKAEAIDEKMKRKEKDKKRKRDGVDGADNAAETGAMSGENQKKKKKKRERERDENGADKEIERGATSDVKDSTKKARKKMKKTKKNKAKNEDQNQCSETRTGGGEEQNVVEAADASHSQGNVDSSTKVYVGGIPFYSTEDDIRSFFESCGTITEVDCMVFPESGKFRGIAILSFKTEAAAKRALALDGADMGGLYLKLKPYEAARAAKSSAFAPEMVRGYNRAYVGNLSWDITEDDLKKFFSNCSVSSIRFGMDKETEEFRGYAHVDFSESASLATALKLDQRVLCGRPVKVSCAVPKKRADGHSQSAQASEKTDVGVGVGVGVTSSGTGKKKRRTCYECGVAGHISSACPKKRVLEGS